MYVICQAFIDTTYYTQYNPKCINCFDKSKHAQLANIFLFQNSDNHLSTELEYPICVFAEDFFK